VRRSHRRERVLPPSSGCKLLGTATGLCYRAVVETDGEAEEISRSSHTGPVVCDTDGDRFIVDSSPSASMRLQKRWKCSYLKEVIR
jgi:hypothetical protein